MSSGRYKHRIKFVSTGTITNAFGVVGKATDTKVLDTKGNVLVISGAERINQGTALDTEFISVMLRSDTRIKHDLTMLWEGKRYNIDNIRPDDRKMRMIVQGSREIRNV